VASLFTDPQAQRELTPLAERMRPRVLTGRRVAIRRLAAFLRAARSGTGSPYCKVLPASIVCIAPASDISGRARASRFICSSSTMYGSASTALVSAHTSTSSATAVVRCC
jgi:hypothetical protein